MYPPEQGSRGQYMPATAHAVSAGILFGAGRTFVRLKPKVMFLPCEILELAKLSRSKRWLEVVIRARGDTGRLLETSVVVTVDVVLTVVLTVVRAMMVVVEAGVTV